MPRKVSEALKSWEASGMNAKDRNRWRIIRAIYGGLFEKKGTLCVLRA